MYESFIASCLKLLTEAVEDKNSIQAKSQHSEEGGSRFLCETEIPSLKPVSFLSSTFSGISRSLILATHTILPIWLDFRSIWWPILPWPVLLYFCLTMAQRQWCVYNKKHVDPEKSDPSPDAPGNKGNHYFDMLISHWEHTSWEFYQKSWIHMNK